MRGATAGPRPARRVSAAADLWEVERELRRGGHAVIAGVDEAGRGPLAGPVVAAAVAFPAEFTHPGIDDSKRLTARQRECLVPVITGAAVAWAVAAASETEIDAVNILQATLRAMSRALASLRVPPAYVLVDGTTVPDLPVPGAAVKGGDRRVACIAAASILAKVHRDRLMDGYHVRWPAYGFDRNRGYGTAAHLAALAVHGPCPIHRRSFRRVVA